MYRTEQWLQNAPPKLKTPLCIPSYSRPNAFIFTKLFGFSPDEVFVFVRKNQLEDYQVLSSQVTLIPLPEWVYEVGTTREAIVQWAQAEGYENIFMLDDRIVAVNYLIPKTSNTGKQSLVAPSGVTMRDGLIVWEKILEQYPFTLSAPAHKGFSYYPENINAPYTVNNGIVAAACSINVQDLKKYDLHYKPLDKCGGEDICMMLDVMSKGLPTCKITDLEYDEVASTKITKGGNRVAGVTQHDAVVKRNKIFWKNVLGLEYPAKHEYVYTRNTGGIPYPYIRWKYWQEFYAQHSVKGIPNQPSNQQTPQQPVTQYTTGDLYHIPGDSGKPWRFRKMVEYIGNFPDEIGPVINAWFKQHQATDDDKVWWVFLYSTCYCMGSAMVMAETLDYTHPLNSQELEDYWMHNKPKLIFQSDRRYIKNMNQFTQMYTEFIARTNGKLYEYISQFVTDDPEETYRRLYQEISSWRYYGRFGTILFIFNLCKVFPHIQVESKIYDWKSGATTTSAIYNARYEDEKANAFDAGKVTLTPEDINMLDATLQIITDELQKYKPEKKWNIIYVSSDLCSFRKLFKGVRYQGYYVDRQQEEIQLLQKNFPEHKDIWDFVWKARSQYINSQYLGEVNGWDGIRKERMKLFLDHGYVGADSITKL